MSFRRAFSAFAVSLAVPAAATGPGRAPDRGRLRDHLRRHLRLSHRLHGPLQRRNATTSKASTFKEGALKAMTMHYDGRNRAWGGFSAQGARPSAGRCRSWWATRRAPGSPSTAPAASCRRPSQPVWKPTPQQVIPESTSRARSIRCRRRSASAWPATPPATSRCASNDGKRRIDIILRKIGMEPAASTGIAGAQGDVLVCEIYTKRVSGEFDDAPQGSRDRARAADQDLAGPFRQHAVPLSRQARGADPLRHDPRQDAVLPRASADAGRKPGDAALGGRRGGAWSTAIRHNIAQDYQALSLGALT